jgi:hypothetical protein
MLTTYVRRALELPLHVAVKRAVRLAARAVAQRVGRSRDAFASTFPASGPSQLRRRISVAAGDVPKDLAAILPELAERYLDHRFDLLGSGWVQVYHGLSAAGLEGHRFPPGARLQLDKDGKWISGHVNAANLPEAQRLWRLIEGDYVPIDWQIDFKSGFRWDGCRHFRDLRFGTVRGADIKVPWELSRLQHLPQLAIAHLLAKAGRDGFREPAVYAREVRNQIIDFLATNPPRYGVNWLCPMDVGIRVANMLVAQDLLRAGGVTIPAALEEAIAKTALAHARHILANLEWSPSPRSNHYLADIAGVLFSAIYLPADPETDAWIDFVAQQFDAEIPVQFLADGGNFEGSTNYHRLSAEISLFSTAALMGVAQERADAFRFSARNRLRIRPPLGSGPMPGTPDSAGQAVPLSRETMTRLERAIGCVAGWSKPDGRPPQIGDTDSGRLFKLHPTVSYFAGEPHEDVLHHGALLSAGAGLFDQPPVDWIASDGWFDAAVVTSLAGGRKLVSSSLSPDSIQRGDTGALMSLVAEVRALPPDSRREVSFDLPGFVPAQLRQRHYPEFGLVVLRSEDTFISLRCVAAYDGSHTHGHYHDDNLALEVHHRGTDIITDPGSYLYTPIVEFRERYRCAAAHGVPRCDKCNAAEAVSTFAMRFTAAARCIYAGPAGVGGVLEGNGWRASRAVLNENGRIVVLDGCVPGVLQRFAPAPPVTRGYGRF